MHIRLSSGLLLRARLCPIYVEYLPLYLLSDMYGRRKSLVAPGSDSRASVRIGKRRSKPAMQRSPSWDFKIDGNSSPPRARRLALQDDRRETYHPLRDR